MRLAAFFNPKAAKWIQGRKGLFTKLEAAIQPTDRVIWMHCASLGEFEQGRPLLEELRTHYPSHRILLTFFSPSGYEVQKNYPGADWVFYLPMDGTRNANRFLDIVHPELVIFVKYEFWFFYLKKLQYRNVPLLLVAALFRKEMSFFSWYGHLSRKMASRFNHIFVQNQSSYQLLQEIGLHKIASIAGDTRFDRVVSIAKQAAPIQTLRDFAEGKPLLIAGSTWPADEKALAYAFSQPTINAIKLVLAPHEITEAHLQEIEAIFPGSVRLSCITTVNYKESNVLIIDNYGMLSRAYQHANIAYVGGGLQASGIHNVLEAAVYGIPVVFGSRYEKYAEAVELVKQGGALPLPANQPANEALTDILQKLIGEDSFRKQIGAAALKFVYSQQGSTQKIMDLIKRILNK